jgi:hypothetical protein
MKSIDDDISQTLEKLFTLLQYSNDQSADTVFSLIEQAKKIWTKDEENIDNIISFYPREL